MNWNENEAESFAGNFVVCGEYGLFFEVPIHSFYLSLACSNPLNKKKDRKLGTLKPQSKPQSCLISGYGL